MATSSTTSAGSLHRSTTICGWSTQPRSSRPQPRDHRCRSTSWRDGQNTATARRIPGTFGGCVSTFWLPHRVCRSSKSGRLLRPKKTNATSPWRCWPAAASPAPDRPSSRTRAIGGPASRKPSTGPVSPLPSREQNRETATRAAVPPPVPPDHQVDQQHPQNPALISNGTADVPKPV